MHKIATNRRGEQYDIIIKKHRYNKRPIDIQLHALIHGDKKPLFVYPDIQRKGIRAAGGDLPAALETIQWSRPQFDKPAYVIKSIDIDREGRVSGSDNALFELLLAFARFGGIEKETHQVDASVVMKAIGIISIDRFADSLTRVSQTMVKYFARDRAKNRKIRGYCSMLAFSLHSLEDRKEAVELGIEGCRHILRFSIPEDLRIIYSQLHREFTWLDLKAILSFRSRYTNSIYQLLAIKAGHFGIFQKPLKIEAKKLADIMGWKEETWIPSHFIERCLTPALKDIEEHVADFSVEFSQKKVFDLIRPGEVRQKHERRKTSAIQLSFFVIRKRNHRDQVQATFIKRATLRKATIMELSAPDFEHDECELPSVGAISRMVHWYMSKPDFADTSSADVIARTMSGNYRLWLADFKAELLADPAGTLEKQILRYKGEMLTGSQIWEMLEDDYKAGRQADHLFEIVSLQVSGDQGRFRRTPVTMHMPPRLNSTLSDTSYDTLKTLIYATKDIDRFGFAVFGDWYFHQYLDIGVSVWEDIFEDIRWEKWKAMTRSAFKILEQAWIDDVKYTLRNLAYAAWLGDVERFEKIIRAVHAKKYFLIITAPKKVA